MAQLTELHYAKAEIGPWKLYVYGRSGYHTGGTWFRKGVPLYPDEEITVKEARFRTEKAISERREVRICDGGDMLVFHSQDGEVVYGDDFWEAAQ
jgi:hypothetical protein